MARYLLLAAEYTCGSEELETAFDLQVLQKVLPKLAGKRKSCISLCGSCCCGASSLVPL